MLRGMSRIAQDRGDGCRESDLTERSTQYSARASEWGNIGRYCTLITVSPTRVFPIRARSGATQGDRNTWRH